MIPSVDPGYREFEGPSYVNRNRPNKNISSPGMEREFFLAKKGTEEEIASTSKIFPRVIEDIFDFSILPNPLKNILNKYRYPFFLPAELLISIRLYSKVRGKIKIRFYDGKIERGIGWSKFGREEARVKRKNIFSPVF